MNVIKGVVVTVDGNRVRVSPGDARSRKSLPMAIPWFLRSGSGVLQKGTEVAYVLFNDQTGIILGRMDGNGEFNPCGGRNCRWQ
jgi:hypothetical protein